MHRIHLLVTDQLTGKVVFDAKCNPSQVPEACRDLEGVIERGRNERYAQVVLGVPAFVSKNDPEPLPRV